MTLVVVKFCFWLQISETSYWVNFCGSQVNKRCFLVTTPNKWKEKSAYGRSGPSGRRLSPLSVVRSDQECFYSPLDGMLVQRRVTLSFKFGGTHLTTGVNDWSTVRVKVSYPRTKHNVRSQGSNPDPRSGVKRTNHEATAPPTNK